jgi:sulfur carrier protein ThiS
MLWREHSAFGPYTIEALLSATCIQLDDAAAAGNQNIVRQSQNGVSKSGDAVVIEVIMA